MLCALAPMHVLWVNDRADFVGGAERYVADTARLVRERGHRTTLFYGVPGWMEPKFTSLFDAAFPMVDVGRQIAELRPDVIYVHQLSDRAALRAITDSGVPSIRFFHDHALFCLREHKYRTVSHETCTRTVGLGCYPCLGFVRPAPTKVKVRLRTLGDIRDEQDDNRQVNAFVVGSHYMRDHAVAHGFPAHAIDVIPPFVVPPAPATVERKPNRLLFVGALLRGKGLDILLHAMTQVRSDVRLHVIGTGKQEHIYRDMVSELGLADRVHFVGQVGRDDLQRAYAEATCVIVPSRTPETFGLTGPEAFLHGTPVIAAAVGGMGEWLRDGETGLSFPSGDSAALAKAIGKVLADPAAAAAMAARGRALCETEFSSERHVSRLIDVLAKVGRG